MSLPFFYSPEIAPTGGFMGLGEENAKHIIQVLRMKKGYELKLTDGKGTIAQCMISEIEKKSCTVLVKARYVVTPPAQKIIVAVSLLKNSGRFEWFLEKAVETGVDAVVPLICHRTERQVFKESRMQNIAVSAMLQSQQSWLTEVLPPKDFLSLIRELPVDNNGHRYIAHCDDEQKNDFVSVIQKHGQSALLGSEKEPAGWLHSSLILIGPEGDFTADEITAATTAGCTPVSLGETRLRTETAAITAAILLKHLG